MPAPEGNQYALGGNGGAPIKLTRAKLKEAEKLARIQCTEEEIASFLDVDVRTLQRSEEFCRIHKKGMEYGKASLRRLQWKSAEDGNVTSQVWLGKQYLKQRDNKDISVSDARPIQIVDDLPDEE